MLEVSAGRMAKSLREEYTSTALKRSANIENCAPDGYFSLIHAVALTAFDGHPVPVSSVREKYNSGVKDSKDIMENCGVLTAQPFPIIESTKKRSLNSDEVINSPLYDESTGITVQEKYSNVVLSELGRLLTRHYVDKELSQIENYNSIVPLGLLRKSMPWTMGHKGEMQPLNPSELFKIIDKMLETNTPFVSPEFILENFKGVDLGPNYDIYTNTKSLLTLYSKGEMSLIVVPKIEIRRKEMKIVIKRPPLDSTTKKLITYLRQKSIEKGPNQYNYFNFSPKVDMVGNEAHINVKKFNTNDDKLIYEDFLRDTRIAKKIYIKNESILFKEDPVTRSSLAEDSILGEPVDTIKVSDIMKSTDKMSKEELKTLKMEDFVKMLDKFSVKELERRANDDNYDGELPEEVLKSSKEIRNSTNPYNFELDLMPVYEVLWRCILGERKLVQVGLKKKLKELLEQLKDDLLMEKATRPEVAQLIYKLQPDKNREQLLYQQTRKGSEVLEEGFELWEVEEIYKSRGNNILPNIFSRDKFKDLYKKTQKNIDDMEEKINSPEILNKMIRNDISKFIKDEKYQRKSEVHFIPDFGEEFSTKKDKVRIKDQITITSRHDNLDLPCTLYYNGKEVIRNYGVNMYFNSFVPLFELNTTNYSEIQVITSNKNTNEINMAIMKAKDIPLTRTLMFGKDSSNIEEILGIVPVEEGKKFILWTNKNRFYVYDKMPGYNFGIEPDEKILGWEYYDKQFLDLRTSKGILTVEKTEFPQFKKGLKPVYNNLGNMYDMYNKQFSDKVIRIRNNITGRDHKKQRRVLWKTKYAQPIDLAPNMYDYVFTPHRTRYFNGIYIHKWKDFGQSKFEKYLPPKKVKLTEYAMTEDNTTVTKKLYNNILKEFHRKPEEDEVGDLNELGHIFLIARFTNSYLDFDLEEFEKFGVIDSRALALYRIEKQKMGLTNESRREYEDRIEQESLEWSNSDDDDLEDDK